MPCSSWVGGLGCGHTAIRPLSPSVLRKRVPTLHFCAVKTRSWLRISFETAAAISGVMRGATAASLQHPGPNPAATRENPPTVRWLIAAKAALSRVSRMSRVISSRS